MSEDMAASPAGERPRWLDVAMTVIPPLSLITALLVYFGYIRRIAYAQALGINVDLMEEASVPGYVLRSTQPLFLPLLIANVGLLLWLWADRTLHRWLHSRIHLRTISRTSWVLLAGAAILVPLAGLIAMASSRAKPYVNVALPFLLALAVLAAAYGFSLRRRLRGRSADQDNVRHRWAINAMVGLLVSLLLFWAMDDFARVVGYGVAEGIIKQPQLNTYPVLLYSAQDLQLDPGVAVRQELSGSEHTAYRYRYQGLRLAFVDGGRYFLIGRNWQPRGGRIIVMPPDGLRLEFLRGRP